MLNWLDMVMMRMLHDHTTTARIRLPDQAPYIPSPRPLSALLLYVVYYSTEGALSPMVFSNCVTRMRRLK